LQIYIDHTKQALEISSDHLLFVQRESDLISVPASTVEVGDSIVVSMLDREVCQVERIESVTRVGAFAPFTVKGTIVVNGVVASSYVALQKDAEHFKIGDFVTPFTIQWLSHTFTAHRRMLCSVRFDLCKSETYDSDGISVWVVVPFRFSRWFLERSTVVQTVALFLFLVYAFLVSTMETVVSSRALLLLVFGSAYFAFTFRIRSGKVKRE
jgi:hypothetical protein